MRVEVEPGHEDHAVDAHLPLLGEHLLGVSPEVACAAVFVAVFLGFEELLGFGEEHPDEANSDGEAGGDPEDCLRGVNFKCVLERGRFLPSRSQLHHRRPSSHKQLAHIRKHSLVGGYQTSILWHSQGNAQVP